MVALNQKYQNNQLLDSILETLYNVNRLAKVAEEENRWVYYEIKSGIINSILEFLDNYPTVKLKYEYRSCTYALLLVTLTSPSCKNSFHLPLRSLSDEAKRMVVNKIGKPFREN